jgi:putative hydrolase of HD superfamily
VSQADADFAQLIRLLLGLKRLKRTGWLDRGAPPDQVESVADHSYFTALIAWLSALDRPDLDATRVLKLAMVHDLAEAIVGDLPPYSAEDLPDPGDPDAVRAFFSVRHVRTTGQRAAKRAAEAVAIDQIARLMPDRAGAEFLELLREYEARDTPESRFVKDVDTLEAYLESLEQARLLPGLPVDGFAAMAQQELSDPLLQQIRDAAAALDP